MPESPPVTSAPLPSSLPEPAYSRISSRGSGSMSPSRPGRLCCWVGNSWSSLMAAALPGRGPRQCDLEQRLPVACGELRVADGDRGPAEEVERARVRGEGDAE